MTTTTKQAKRTVLAAFVATIILGTVREIKDKGLPAPRMFVGAFGVVIALNVLAGPWPEGAAGIAMIALVATLLGNGDTLKASASALKRKDKG